MAVVQNPITGRSRNKFASAIFQTWKGKNVLRSKPLTVANPQSPAQKTQREKLKQMVKLYRLISGVIEIGYKSLAVGKSEYNAFASEVLKNAFEGETVETVSLVEEDIRVAKGTITPTPILAVTQDNTDFTATWDENAPLQPGQSVSDTAVIVGVYQHPTTKEIHAYSLVSNVKRDVGSVTLTNAVELPTPSWFMVFFRNSVTGNVSDSVSILSQEE